MTQFRDLDPLLHSQLRLAIMSILISVDSADFIYLREKTEATAGNLSVQIGKLKEAGYISVKKSFGESYPQTMCSITELGRQRFAAYVAALRDYLGSVDQKTRRFEDLRIRGFLPLLSTPSRSCVCEVLQ